VHSITLIVKSALDTDLVADELGIYGLGFELFVVLVVIHDWDSVTEARAAVCSEKIKGSSSSQPQFRNITSTIISISSQLIPQRREHLQTSQR
jgi:hypothetical protein